MSLDRSPDQNAGLCYTQDLIAALSTAQGPAALAVIRISGKDCVEAVKSIISPSSKLTENPRKLILCKLLDPGTDDVIDQPLATFLPGPHSFTGEDTLEISLHGGPYIVQKALSALYKMGCRPAEPGEFTRRAYLNGKMDLTTAEGVRYLVEAQSEQQWIAGQQLTQGRLASDVEALRLSLIRAMAFLEARIDFPDEGETSDVELQQVHELVKNVTQRIRQLLDTYDSGRIAADGLRVALVGPPNAGKSTLFNHLLGMDRALVTDIAGTTRDYLEESCRIDGRMLRLIDTAGLRETADRVEQLGIARAQEILRNVDVVLLLSAADQSEDQANEAYLEATKTLSPKTKIFRVLTKGDLGRPKWVEDTFISVSTNSDLGIRQLTEALGHIIDHHILPLKESTFVTSARHVHALEQAEQQCQAFFTAYEQGAFDEMLAFELQRGAKALANLIGHIDHEDVLDRIFSEFCVGK